ncbi:MAG: hypothetical protein V4676_08105 [Bacteroidota bacterium]
MKKVLSFILLLIYFTVSTGFVVSFHYCMDEIESVELGRNHSDECGVCGMQQGDNGCCRDDVKMLKLHTDHLVKQVVSNNEAPVVLVQTVTNISLTPFYNFQQQFFGKADEGPPINKQYTYLRNRVFLI